MITQQANVETQEAGIKCLTLFLKKLSIILHVIKKFHTTQQNSDL